jgi:hypothetical protein
MTVICTDPLAGSVQFFFMVAKYLPVLALQPRSAGAIFEPFFTFTPEGIVGLTVDICGLWQGQMVRFSNLPCPRIEGVS